MAASVFAAVCEPPISTHGVKTGDSRDTYLRCTGAASSYATVPDSTGLDLGPSFEFEIVVRGSTDSWAAGTSLVAKWNSAGGAGAYSYLFEAPGGFLRLQWSATGAAALSAISTVVGPFVNGTAYWLKVTMETGTGTVKFYYAPDSDDEPALAGWTQLGATVVSGATSIFNSTQQLAIYANSNGSFRNTGNVYFVAIRDDLATPFGSSTVFACDFTRQTAGASTITANGYPASHTVTMNSSVITADTNDWRFAVEALVGSHGARVGYAKVGTAKVTSPKWLDITSDLLGLEWSRGKVPSSPGYPRSDVGVGKFTLANDTGKYSPWNESYGTVTDSGISTDSIHREWKPGTLIRVVMFKPNATCSYTTAASGFTYISRAHWVPRFTGIVEQWDESIEKGRNTVSVTLTETLGMLGAYNSYALTSQGANDTLVERLSRLTADAKWKTPIVESSRELTVYDEAIYPLQATTMEGNRLAEVYLSAESVFNTQVFSDTDGSMMVGVDTTWRYTSSYPTTSGQVMHFTSSPTQAPSSDRQAFPVKYTAYYEEPLVISHTTDFILNYVGATRVGGGVAQAAGTTPSQGLYGLRAYVRTDLISANDTMVDLYCDEVLNEVDAWTDPTITTYAAGLDHAIQPGAVTISNQQRAQRKIRLHGLALVDWYGSAAIYSLPSVRFSGRIVKTQDTITKSVGGIEWTTTLHVLSRLNYRPT